MLLLKSKPFNVNSAIFLFSESYILLVGRCLPKNKIFTFFILVIRSINMEKNMEILFSVFCKSSKINNVLVSFRSLSIIFEISFISIDLLFFRYNLSLDLFNLKRNSENESRNPLTVFHS